MSFKALSRDSGNNILLPTKSKRSQSALEYMMTYGWAILIIVIVAVILYSMGIFNPSSSITFTSSGFSPFTVSSSLCNNLGYKIAVLAGPMPNNANSLQIDKVYLTSATGANSTTASYTLKNPVTLKSGQSATILIPNVACNAANIHYSISANIQYSYTASTLGLQTVNTTGTVAGTSIAGKPSVLTSYEPLTITNTQNTATPNPFQQMVVFNSTDPGFSSIATGNFGQNVEFFYYNGTVVPSWLENYTTDNATWWLKIAAIPAGSSETVYVGFAPTTTNLFNTVNDGQAPQISSTYAEYDDGANVFNFYYNFAGTTLPGDLTEIVVDNSNTGATGTFNFNNGLNITSTKGSDFWDTVYVMTLLYYNKPVSKDQIFEAQINSFNIGSSDTLYDKTGLVFQNAITDTSTQNGEVSFGTIESINTFYLQWQSGTSYVSPTDNSFAITAVYPSWISLQSPNSTYIGGFAGPSIESVSQLGGYESPTNIQPTGYIGLFITDESGIGTTSAIYQFFLSRATPPNGVMPSVSFGSIA